MGKYQIGVDKFDGGLNTKAQPLNVKLDQLTEAQSVWFDDYGAIETVPGVAQLNNTQIGSGPIDGLFSYKPSTMSAQLVAACNGAAHVATGAATTFNNIASSVTVWTAGTPVEMVQQNELLFFSNGNVKPYKFNGTEFTQMGVSAPSTVLTATTNGAGNLTGSYAWVYTGVNSYLAEGDYSSATATFAAASESVVVGSIPTAPISAGIEYYKIYRNTAGEEGVYYYITDVTNGVTSFTDNQADSSISTTEAPTDNGSPRFFKYMLPAMGRMWGAGDSNKDYLWYSDVNQPEVFPALNFLRVGRGDGLDISGIAELNGNIVISKSDFQGRTAVYELAIGDSTTNSDPANWYLKKTGDGVGSDSHRAMVNYGNYITMFNHSGVYAYTNGGSALVITETRDSIVLSENISELIEPNIIEISNDTFAKNAFNLNNGINWKNKIWFGVVGTNDNEVSELWFFDFARVNRGERTSGAWSIAPGQADFKYGQMVKHENGLYGGYAGSNASNDGKIFQLDTTRSGTITHKFKTAPFQGKKGHEQNWKDFRWVYITHDTAAYNLTIKTYVDSLLNDTYLIDLTADGTETTKVTKIRLNGEQGRYIQFEGLNLNLAQPFRIRKIELVYNLRGLRN